MSDLMALSNEQLADAFAEISRQQGEAMEDENTRKYSRLLKKLQTISAELRSRGADARKILVPLLKQGDEPSWSYQAAQRRYNAAQELEAVVPELARTTLEEIASRGPSMYRLMARTSLRRTDEGTSPT